LLRYTGVPIIEGRDVYREAISSVRGRMAFFAYEELDPDVFGEELDRDAYASAERLAVVGLDAIKNVDV
jgi:hypothetical protein